MLGSGVFNSGTVPPEQVNTSERKAIMMRLEFWKLQRGNKLSKGNMGWDWYPSKIEYKVQIVPNKSNFS